MFWNSQLNSEVRASPSYNLFTILKSYESLQKSVWKATYQYSSKSAVDTKIRKKAKHVLYKPTTSGSPPHLYLSPLLPPLHKLTQILSLTPWPEPSFFFPPRKEISPPLFSRVLRSSSTLPLYTCSSVTNRLAFL